MTTPPPGPLAAADGAHGHSHTADAPGPLADASVRRAGPNDAAAVGLVQEAVWQETYAPRVPAHVAAQFTSAGFASAWRRSLASPPQGVYTLLVACAGDQVVGYAAIGPSQDLDGEPTTGSLMEIGVHPRGRRSGHGSRLLNAAADLLTEAGASEITAWLPADAEDTRAFFEQSGLQPDGAYRDRGIVDDVTLREIRVAAGLAHDD